MLTNTELNIIAELIRNNPDRYLFERRIDPQQGDLIKLAEILREDLPGIAEKAIENPLFRAIGIRSLYRGIHGTEGMVSIYPSDSRPDRPLNQKITIGDTAFRIKDFQGEQELEISKKAGELGIGPKQYGPGVEIAEEDLGDPDAIIHELWRELNNPTAPSDLYELDRNAGKVLKRLHDADIIYADNLVGHVREIDGQAKAFDFGRSFICTPPVSHKLFLRSIHLIHGNGYFLMFEKMRQDPELEQEYKDNISSKVKAADLKNVKLTATFGTNVPHMADSIEEGYSN